MFEFFTFADKDMAKYRKETNNKYKIPQKLVTYNPCHIIKIGCNLNILHTLPYQLEVHLGMTPAL